MATDGLVMKVNSLRQQLNLGSLRQESAMGHCLWGVSGRKKKKSASNLEPVLLSGTIVLLPSLHNADIVARSASTRSDMHLAWKKVGEIIPKNHRRAADFEFTFYDGGIDLLSSSEMRHISSEGMSI